MTSLEFCMWLKGYFDIFGVTPLTSKQIDTIQRHLTMAFYLDIDKSYGEKHEENLGILHTGVKPKPAIGGHTISPTDEKITWRC